MFNNYASVLFSTGLFEGINTQELSQMLACLAADLRTCRKGDLLLLAGDTPEDFGIVLEGQIHIIKETPDGNRTLIAALGPAGLYAEALCLSGAAESPVSVLASADSAVMRINASRILRACSNSCVFHTRLLANLLNLIAQKNLFLQHRLDIISHSSIRSRVMTYLQSFALRQGQTVSVPLNREEMADYLCVDRSALSHELMRMKKDGLLTYHKNTFTLL